MFSKLWVEKGGHITAELAPLFAMAFKSAIDAAGTLEKQEIRSTDVLTDFLSVIPNRIQKIFGCDWSNGLLVRVAI